MQGSEEGRGRGEGLFVSEVEKERKFSWRRVVGNSKKVQVETGRRRENSEKK